MGDVAIVTDSTVDLAIEAADELQLRVVPMTVSFGAESFISRLTIGVEEFYDRLERDDDFPTTSQPVPAWFEEAYGDAADEGCSGVVSIHVSGALSGTCDAASLVAERAPLPVRVVDSRQVSGGLLLSVLAAQRLASAGAALDEVAERAERVAAAARMFVVVDTLDYLRKGGRLSGAQALVGNVLRVKPILGVVDGEVVALEKARTWTRALPRVAELVEEEAAGRPVSVIVSHALAPDRAAEVWAALDERVEIVDRRETVIGPVVGAHCGPGTVGVAIAPVD